MIENFLEYGQWVILLLSILSLALVSSVKHETRLNGYILTGISRFAGALVFVFVAKYSVMPLNLFFKKVFLEIGPLINLLEISFLINLNAISKQDEMYLFDLDEILSNALF